MATKHELEAMTKDELVARAEGEHIEVQHSWLKDDIISAILKGERKAAKHAAKHEGGFPVAAEQQVNPETGVSPELEELQRQANGPVDNSTRFAAKRPDLPDVKGW